jgi:uncharacterized protein
LQAAPFYVLEIMLYRMDSLELTLNAAAQRYEARLEGHVVAFIEYRDAANARSLTHTKVNEDLEGQGIGGQLVKFALEGMKSSGSSLVPICPFVATYVQRHREYAELVAPAHRTQYGL